MKNTSAKMSPLTTCSTFSIVADAVSPTHAMARMMLDVPVMQLVLDLIAKAKEPDVVLLAPLCAASALETFLPEAANNKQLQIAILGAERIDSGIDGQLYQMLGWMIGNPHLQISAEIIGPQLPSGAARQSRKRSVLPQARLTQNTCGQWWLTQRRNKRRPDIIFVFHPGLEKHARQWLLPHELPTILKSGIPVVFFSYDLDEAERDAAILRAHGVATSIPKTCHMGEQSRRPRDGESSAATLFGFASAMFQAKGFTATTLNDEVIDDIARLSEVMFQVFAQDRRWEMLSDAFKPCHVMRKKQLVPALHIFGQLFFDSASQQIWVCHHGEVLEKLCFRSAVDWAAQARQCRSPLDKAILAAKVFRQLMPDGLE